MESLKLDLLFQEKKLRWHVKDTTWLGGINVQGTNEF